MKGKLMKVKMISVLCLAGLTAVGVCAEGKLQKPNVVIIYGDDVGFGDVGAYGSRMIPTPNIDRLASEGLLFTDGHSSAATCSPSRFSMLTGIYAFRKKVSILPPEAPLSISTKILTLPKLFKQVGYTTGVVGKWHLGIGKRGTPVNWNGDVKPGPLEIGFDTSFLFPITNDRVPCVYLDGHRVVNLDPADPIYVGKTKKDVDRPGSRVILFSVVSCCLMGLYNNLSRFEEIDSVFDSFLGCFCRVIYAC